MKKRLLDKFRRRPGKPIEHHNLGQTPAHPHRERGKRVKSGLSTIGILLLAPIIALFLTAFVFQSYQVDGPSMETTLHDNDRLIIIKAPRTWSKLTGHAYIPRRADVIVFVKRDLREFNGGSGNKQLIKRVIGLPGERVVVEGGQLTVYNNQHPSGFQPDRTYAYGKAVQTTPGNIDITVPENEVFVSGDNRPNSLDSRVFGPIPLSDIVGRLSVRILPLNSAKKF